MACVITIWIVITMHPPNNIFSFACSLAFQRGNRDTLSLTTEKKILLQCGSFFILFLYHEIAKVEAEAELMSAVIMRILMRNLNTDVFMYNVNQCYNCTFLLRDNICPLELFF